MIWISNLENLSSAEDSNGSVIVMDVFIVELCNYGDDIEKLIEPQKLFYLNQNLEREINNGGFSQYFVNSSGDFPHEIIETLKTIGAERTANILQGAISQFPNKKVPENRDERIELVEEIEEVANEVRDDLDQKFYEYVDDLNSLNIDYIKKNKDYFKFLY
jgi:Domain of unknown function (DUF4375)